ncbi:GNAT family N-acetyltransferase [Actinomadura chokoriensis]|uniref:GNAT family protein n=1 Tax=Actinomadura chokoriensis TaxID=454156 RepID=A0ABV4QW79_9ACTN
MHDGARRAAARTGAAPARCAAPRSPDGGVATEALRQALDVAFGALRLHRVEAFTRVDNHASQRVLRKNGFTAVGTSRRHIHLDGRWHDERLFECLAHGTTAWR